MFQTSMLNLLMNSVRETIDTFTKRTFNGGKTGFMMVLHTWNQELLPHYHVHILIAAGALNKSDDKWQESQKEFLFSIHALAKVFRAVFKRQFAEKFKNKNIIQPKSPKKWNVYCKPPYRSVETCIKYFALYCNRVAVSDRRLTHIDKQKQEVTITYKRKKMMHARHGFTLSFKEFLSRFAMHILPKGFSKIRYCGLYSNRGDKEHKKRALELISNSKALKSTSKNMDKKPSHKKLCPQCSHVLWYCVIPYQRVHVETPKTRGSPLSTNKQATLSLHVQTKEGASI